MSFYSPFLPLTRDKINGYKMLDDIRDVVKQNFKMLILTNPGERIMIPGFGVGIYRFLFENYGPELNNRVSSEIRSQVRKFLPYLQIRNIQFGPTPQSSGAAEIDANSLNIVIEYTIEPLNFSDSVKINVNQQF